MNSEATRPEDLVIQIDGLVKIFGQTKALAGVDLRVKRGEVHALLGRNGAGKSTLISILTGLQSADGGEIVINSESGPVSDPMAYIGCVYQKSTLVPGLSAAENIALGHYPIRRGLVSWKQMNGLGRQLLEEWGFGHLAERPVDSLEPLEKKIVEVCRALSKRPEILILDEPTAGLDEGSTAQLFEKIADAKSRGVTIIYVSHHLEEIFQICDSATIIRDGRNVVACPIADLTTASIAKHMTGEERSDLNTTRARALGEQAAIEHVSTLQVSNVTFAPRVRDFSLTVRSGECVGLTGLDGAGHVQIGQMIAGELAPTSGTVSVDGEPTRGSVASAIDHGIGFVPEDRHLNGFVPSLSVAENSTLTILNRITNALGLVSTRQQLEKYDELAQAWSIKASGPDQPIEELSGGNQQKVVLARALASEPAVLVLMHPTAGVDVSAKASIYDSLRVLQQTGCAIVVVSSDDDDLRLCDYVIAMHKGKIHKRLESGYQDHELVAAAQGAN